MRKAVSKDELEAQQAQADKFQAALDEEQTKLSYHTLTTPFDGELSFTDVAVGALVNPGEVITTLDDLSTMKIDFELPDTSLSSVSDGAAITVTTDVWPGIEFPGTISTISPRINTTNFTYTARALLDNQDNRLLPGMMVRISVQQQPKRTLTVPSRSVMFDGNDKFVYVIDQQSKAHKQYVQTGETLEEMIAITDGLSFGEKIVDEGVVKVRDGQPVKIIEASIAENTDKPDRRKSQKGNMDGKGEAQS